MIRNFRPGDGTALRELCIASITGLGSRHYSSDQIMAWRERVPDADNYERRAADGAMIFIATDNGDSPAAYALLEQDGHFDRLYCHPGHSGRGHASALIAHAEEIARANGVTRLFTEASEVARPVFERAGYSVSHRRDFVIDGVAIHNYAMEKRLNIAAAIPVR